MKLSVMGSWAAIAIACFFLGLSAGASAQPYPAKPIKVIIPFAAGNTGEIALRTISPSLQNTLGQPVVLEHKTGAAGNIGAQVVVSAPADGYTLLLGATNNFAVNQYLIKDMGFDPLKALVPISAIAESPPAIFIHPSVPAENLRDFVAYAKANPGKLNYGSPGSGTTPHLAVELLMQQTGIVLTHVPFRGSPPAMAALLANDVQLFMVGLSAGIGQIKAGKLRVLAVTSRTRLPGAPHLPTAIESGFPDFEASNHWVLAGPEGTSQEVVTRVADAVRVALKNPEILKRYSDLGFITPNYSSAEIAARLQAEGKQWKQLIESRGITGN